MKLRVRLFGDLRERAGWSERWLTGDQTTTPGLLWEAVAAELGEPVTLPKRIRVAVNQQFAEPTAELCDGDEVAFLPPISGG
jgi:molybdopterin converting factor subunit 1